MEVYWRGSCTGHGISVASVSIVHIQGERPGPSGNRWHSQRATTTRTADHGSSLLCAFILRRVNSKKQAVGGVHHDLWGYTTCFQTGEGCIDLAMRPMTSSDEQQRTGLCNGELGGHRPASRSSCRRDPPTPAVDVLKVKYTRSVAVPQQNLFRQAHIKSRA